VVRRASPTAKKTLALAASALVTSALLAGFGCGDTFISVGSSGGGNTTTATTSGAGGTVGSSSASGSGTGGGAVSSTGAGAGGGQGGQNGSGGSGGGPCLSCAEAFEAAPPVSTKLCSGEGAKLSALNACICGKLMTTCNQCADYCAGIAAPTDDCLKCADDDGSCDAAGKDCNADPF
jgi:hypothetical protein